MDLGAPRRSASGLARSSFETRCVSCAGAQHSAPPASSARGDAFRIQCGVCCRNSKSLCQPRRGRGRSREHQWGSPKRCSCERPPRRFLVNSDRLRPYRCGSPLYSDPKSGELEPDARPGDRRCRAGLPRPLPSKRPAVYNLPGFTPDEQSGGAAPLPRGPASVPVTPPERRRMGLGYGRF